MRNCSATRNNNSGTYNNNQNNGDNSHGSLFGIKLHRHNVIKWSSFARHHQTVGGRMPNGIKKGRRGKRRDERLSAYFRSSSIVSERIKLAILVPSTSKVPSNFPLRPSVGTRRILLPHEKNERMKENGGNKLLFHENVRSSANLIRAKYWCFSVGSFTWHRSSVKRFFRRLWLRNIHRFVLTNQSVFVQGCFCARSQ